MRDENETYFYHYDEETGNEHWHNGEDTHRYCHDGVGLIQKAHRPLKEFLELFPNAHVMPI